MNKSASMKARKSRRGREIMQEQRVEKVPLVGSTTYIALTNNDLMYFGNLDHLTISDFRITIEKIVHDLNILLHYKDEQFWEEL